MSKTKILSSKDALELVDFKLKKEDLINLMVDELEMNNNDLIINYTKEIDDLIDKFNNHIINITRTKVKKLLGSKVEITFIGVCKHNEILSHKNVFTTRNKENFNINSSCPFRNNWYRQSSKTFITIKIQFKDINDDFFNGSMTYSVEFSEDLKSLHEFIIELNQKLKDLVYFDYNTYKKQISNNLTRNILNNVTNGENIYDLLNNKIKDEPIQSKTQKTTKALKSKN